MTTDRRTFLKLTVGGTTFGVVACIPEAPKKSDWRDVYLRDAGQRAEVDPNRDGGVSEKPPRDAGSTVQPPERDGGPISNADAGFVDAGVEPPPRDGGCNVVMMHDTFAQALYFDGTHGPLTGTITVDHVMAGASVEFEFWHGHGGQNHRFTFLPEHFEALKRGERVMVSTSEVDSHSHLLFVDPVDENYRVPGSSDVAVPVC